MALKYSRLPATFWAGLLGYTHYLSFKEVHDWSRKNLKNYYEVFLDTPIEELKKGIPRKSTVLFGNEISNVAGLDIEVDQPKSPDLSVPFAPDKSVQSVAKAIIKSTKLK